MASRGTAAFLRTGVLVACLGVLSAQSPRDPISAETLLLARVRAHMTETLRRIPNYTCVETIERSERRGRAKKARLIDALRLEVAVVDGKELFSWPGERRFEERDLHDLAAGGAMGNGNFALHAKSVFQNRATRFEKSESPSPDSVLRWIYDIAQPFSGYHLRVGMNSAIVGYRGHIDIDARTLDLIELAVMTTEIPPALGLAEVRDTMRYARQRIGGSDFLLPRSSELILTEFDNSENRNNVTFSGCRQYSGESTLRFDDAPEDTSTPSAPASTIPEPLPEEMILEVTLDDDLPLAGAATGDLVTMTLRSAARKKRTMILPKGATLIGRIAAVDRRGIRGYSAGVAFDFVEVRVESQTAHVKAELEEGGSLSLRSSQFALAPAQRGSRAMVYVKSMPPRLPKGLLLRVRTLP